MRTKIEWTDATWNPVTGCTKVSPGCAHCYIERTPPMRMAGRRFVDGKIPVELHPDRLEMPLKWRKPRTVFVCSMGDLFHEDVPDEFIWKVFGVMDISNEDNGGNGHTFQVLTKRPQRMRGVLERIGYFVNPLPNVWLGVSVENQKAADERIPLLLDTPAAVRFVSAEPPLGPLDLGPWLYGQDPIMVRVHGTRGKLDWFIVGGETGPGARLLVEKRWCMGLDVAGRDAAGRYFCKGHWEPKPEALEWVRSIRDQCTAAGVPFFFKQWGPRAGQGTMLDGREWQEMPG